MPTIDSIRVKYTDALMRGYENMLRDFECGLTLTSDERAAAKNGGDLISLTWFVSHSPLFYERARVRLYATAASAAASLESDLGAISSLLVDPVDTALERLAEQGRAMMDGLLTLAESGSAR